MRFLLDTSALLAHYRDEAGSDRVQEIFDGRDDAFLVASITLTEFSRRMFALGSQPNEIETVLAEYRHLFHGVVSIDEKIAMQAFVISSNTSGRLPLADSLIAASAICSEAVLVHRDGHFLCIARDLLDQENLHT